MNKHHASILPGFVLTLAVGITGCTQKQPGIAPAELPAVPVSQPIERKITNYVDFTGRTDAVESVDIRPRVTGYLVKIPFKEGAEVRKGDLLFEIDPRPYQAQLDQAQGQVNLYQAQLKLARTTLARDRAIASSGGPGAVSQQQLDQDVASVDEAAARVQAYQASTEVYKLNLEFTKVTSPINGQASRTYLTLGNLVNQDQTLLTTVVSLDPMYAYFDMDEPTLLRIKQAINEGKIQLPQPGADIPVYLGLQTEDGYPHRGSINFLNNQVNPTTGSISVRGVFPNLRPVAADVTASMLGLLASAPAPAPFLVASTLASRRTGSRLLVPGMFVRIRLPIGTPHLALLVIDRALGSDQGLKYVYVVDKDDKVQYRRVTVGPLQDDGLRVITEGLNREDWVVVGGLQQVRPRVKVEVQQIPMPTLGLSSEADKETTKQGDKEASKEENKRSGTPR